MQSHLDNPHDGKRTILVVDDFDDTRLLLRTWLERKGFRVIEAENGNQAVAEAEIGCPDLIIMDVEMPGMDGITATAALRANTPQSAVVMMSIHDDARTRAQAQAAGAAAFVEKSGMLEVLLATIRQIVEITGRA